MVESSDIVAFRKGRQKDQCPILVSKFTVILSASKGACVNADKPVLELLRDLVVVIQITGDGMPNDVVVRDSNGAQLNDGDSVTLIKDLKVKGTSETIKRGTLVKNIRLNGNPGEIECNTKQVKGLVLKTEFVKKA